MVKCKICGKEMVEDELFASGAVKMLFGEPRNINEETRIVCPSGCSSDYIPKRKSMGNQE